MKIGIANSAEVDAIWPLVSERMGKGCKRCGGDINPGQLWQMCRSGNAFLVVVAEGEKILTAIIVAFEKWDRPVLRCIAAAGWELNEWLRPVLDYLYAMARDNGAESFVFEGREGWRAAIPEAKRLRTLYEVSL